MSRTTSAAVLGLLLMGLAAGSGCGLFREPARGPLALEMVRVEGGAFFMGDLFEGENEDALPVHRVVVETFHLSRYEVSFAQYDAFARATGRPLPDDDGYGRGERAVVNVSWDDAAAFCRAQGLRLPTEAEWEYAARGGGLRQRYAGTNQLAALGAFAFYGGNGPDFSMPVGLKTPNELGLHDMTGNVSEWVGAFYEKYPRGGEAPVYKDLERPGLRVARGGSFHQEEEVARTYWRTGTLNDIGALSIGFRCAR